MIKLRNKVLAEQQPDWAEGKFKVARTIQEGAVKQAVNAYRSNDAKQKLHPTHKYNVKFRSLRSTYTETITFCKDQNNNKKSTLLRFEKRALERTSSRCECLVFFGNNLKSTGGIRMQDSKKAIERLLSEGDRLHEDGKIHWDKRSNTFHFIYTYELPSLTDWDPTFTSKRIVSTDPGCFPFHAWYSPTSGEFGELLKDATLQMEDKCVAIDALMSRTSIRKNARGVLGRARNHRQRYSTSRRLIKKLARMRRNLHGWMENAHYDAANFLLSRFDIVIEPKLAVSELVQHRKRKIQSTTARKMLTWSHYKFRERLKSASFRYAGRYVIESREPGTSKTCTNCGHWKADLQLRDKTYECSSCLVKVDRDVAGARNNFFSEYGRALGIGWDGQSD